MAKKNKLRSLESITLDMEKVLEEMTDPKGHGAQWGEVLNLVHGWLTVHAPQAQEEYKDDDSSPIFYYGPKKYLK